MFNSKNNSLVDSVKQVMEKNHLHRRVEQALNEELGVSSRHAIPNEHLASYDAMLNEAYERALSEEDGSEKAPKKIPYRGDGTGGSKKEPSMWNVVDKNGLVVFGTNKEDSARNFPVGLPDEKNYRIVHRDEFQTGSDVKKEDGLKEEIDYNDEDTRAYLDHAQKHITGKETPHASILSKKQMSSDDIRKITGSNARRIITNSTVNKMNKLHSMFREKMAQKTIKENTIDNIMEEIRSNLEDRLMSIYESGDNEAFEDFVSSLTEEQLELLDLSEVFGEYSGDSSILNRAANQVYSNRQRQAAGQRTRSVGPSSSATPRATPRAAPRAAAPRATPRATAKPDSNDPGGTYTAAPTPTPRATAKPDSNDPGGTYTAAPTPTTAASRTPLPGSLAATRAAPTPTPAPAPAARATPAPASTPTPAPMTAGRGMTLRNAGMHNNATMRSLPGDSTAPKPAAPTPAASTGSSVSTAPPQQQSSGNMLTRFGRSVGKALGFNEESTQIRESLESMIRKNYLKG